MTRPTPSDAAHQALALARERADRDNARQELKHRRYQTALAEAQAEVGEVFNYWVGQIGLEGTPHAGWGGVTAAILTQATLDNLPEDV